MYPAKRRNPVISFLLSIVLPGLGHMYNGELWKGVAAFFGFWMLFMAAALYVVHGPVALVFVPFACQVAVASHAAIRAARLKEGLLQWYNKWPYYIAAWTFANLIVISASFCVGLSRNVGDRTLGQHFVTGAKALRLHHITGYRGFKALSYSMEPALIRGDHFVAEVTPDGYPTPTRGEIVIFPLPEDKSKDFVKRIIGLPGERLQIKDKEVLIDNVPLNDPWAQHYDRRILAAKTMPRDNFGPVTIPQNAVFVMGDNRDFSHDSRFWGFVPTKEIEGKALYIYWSDDVKRIGRRVE